MVFVAVFFVSVCFLSLMCVLLGMNGAAQHSWLTQRTTEKWNFGLENTTDF